MPPDIHEVGRVDDIDGLAIIVIAERDRIRLEVGTSVAVLDQPGAEDFARLLVAAAREAGRQAGVSRRGERATIRDPMGQR